MNEVNKTLFIPLYGKSFVSRQNIIIKDHSAERIWEAEAFPIRGRSKSKWLAYNMAMRAKVFDDWTDSLLEQNDDALVLHIGCGLDSRCERVKHHYTNWIDCDLPEVIGIRKHYFSETESYHMLAMDASDPNEIQKLPDSLCAIVVLEGISMYLTNEQLYALFHALQEKYSNLRIMMDIYTQFGASASKYKNPVNDVGVTVLYGLDDVPSWLQGLTLRLKAEHSFTPENLIGELSPTEKVIFKFLFTGRLYRSLYRLLEFESRI